jgi:hypothetical protein
MNKQDAGDKLKEKSKKIEAIYNEAIAKIKELEKKQGQIVAEYIKKLEQEKIEKIRELLK